MMEQGFIYGRVPAQEICLNPAEVAARMQTNRGFSNQTMQMCWARLQEVLDCRYTARRTAITFPEKDWVDLGFTKVQSHSLYRNLSGCREAFLFAVTLGMGVERLLTKLALLSGGEHFITDALASGAAEAACDAAEVKLRGSLRCKPRFSPGYGDLSLEIQAGMLDILQAQKWLGITLSDSLLMSPMKSITAIMGVCEDESERGN